MLIDDSTFSASRRSRPRSQPTGRRNWCPPASRPGPSTWPSTGRPCATSTMKVTTCPRPIQACSTSMARATATSRSWPAPRVRSRRSTMARARRGVCASTSGSCPRTRACRPAIAAPGSISACFPTPSWASTRTR